MRVCTIPDCKTVHIARGFCGKHYMDRKRAGLLQSKPPVRSMEGFLSRVNKTKSCWEWTGYVCPSTGYGDSGEPAHRIAYKLFKGDIPEGLEIDHLCRNRGCVNPDHLEAVTRHENQMRSNSVSGINHRKTHCINGHKFNKLNTYIRQRPNRNPERDCRTCRRQAVYAFNARRVAS